MANKNLSAAKDAKNDEFYTQLTEIQAEVSNYVDKFENKVVFCNCDDPFESNFVKYFLMNFNRLKLKELIATGYKTSPVGGTDIGTKGEPYALRVTSTEKYLIETQKDLDIKGAKYFLQTEGDSIMFPLIGNPAIDEHGNPITEEIKEEILDDNGNPVLDKKGKPKYKKVKREVFYEAGDFRSDMCIELLKQADVVCTNPPFSLFKGYVAMLMKYEKQFLILGNINAITYKEFFPLLKNNEVWLGCVSGSKEYMVSEGYRKQYSNKVYKHGDIWYSKMGNTGWFTNLDHAKRHQMLPLDLGFTYYGHEDMYPKYDNYDAINVDKVVQIPCDYEPCWYKCPHAASCTYAQTEGKEDKALCEQMSEVDPDGIYEQGGPAFYIKDNNSSSQNVQAERNSRTADSTSESLFVNYRKCNGVIGVPISFFDKYCPEQFIVLECHEPALKLETIQKLGKAEYKSRQLYINGMLCQKQYHRLFIRKV